MAGKVVKYRKNMTLEPMNAYERHVIHTALQDYRGVTTYSTGVEPNRRTVQGLPPAANDSAQVLALKDHLVVALTGNKYLRSGLYLVEPNRRTVVAYAPHQR